MFFFSMCDIFALLVSMEQTYKEMHLFIFPTFTIEREREREKSISGESGADYKIEITTEKKPPPEFPTDWPSLNTASNEKWENIKSFFPLNIFFFYLSLLLVVFFLTTLGSINFWTAIFYSNSLVKFISSVFSIQKWPIQTGETPQQPQQQHQKQ